MPHKSAMTHEPFISVDFDGVLHNYKSAWVAADVVSDGPVPGAIAWLNQIALEYNVVIHTVRSNFDGADAAIMKWLMDNGATAEALDRVTVSASKPSAIIYLDDRAWQFNGPGTFPTAGQIRNFFPWNKAPGMGLPEGAQGLVGDAAK